ETNDSSPDDAVAPFGLDRFGPPPTRPVIASEDTTTEVSQFTRRPATRTLDNCLEEDRAASSTGDPEDQERRQRRPPRPVGGTYGAASASRTGQLHQTTLRPLARA